MASKLCLRFAIVIFLLPAGLQAADRIEKIFPVSKNASLILTNYTGTVSVKGWQNSEIKLVYTKYSQNVEIDTESTPSKVKVTTHVLDKLAAADKARVDYQVFVPEEATLEIVNNMGTVDVENIKGAVKVDVFEAAVKITGVQGGVQATSLGSKVASFEVWGTHPNYDRQRRHCLQQARQQQRNCKFNAGEYFLRR